MRRYWNRSSQEDCKEIRGRKKQPHHKKSSKSLWGKFRALRRKLLESIAQIKLQLRRLNVRVQAVEEQVDSIQGGRRSLTAFLRGRLQTRVTIETTAGTVFGTLVAVGEDFVQILEPSGSIVIIPLRSFLSIA